MTDGATSDRDRLREHLEAALAADDGTDTNYHVRQALQRIEIMEARR